ncbi:MAG: hypothetical protein ACWGP1_01990 [Syntrophobacteria bacterium]
MQAYKKAKAAGEEATALEGKMVDAASVRLARVTFEQARRLGLIKKDID